MLTGIMDSITSAFDKMADSKNLTLDQFFQVYGSQEGEAPPSETVINDRLALLNAENSGDVATANALKAKYGLNTTPVPYSRPSSSPSSSPGNFPSLSMGMATPSKSLISTPLLIGVALAAVLGYTLYKRRA